MIISLRLREMLWLGPWLWHATPVARRQRGMTRAAPRSSRGEGWRCRTPGTAGMALALWCIERPAQGPWVELPRRQDEGISNLGCAWGVREEPWRKEKTMKTLWLLGGLGLGAGLIYLMDSEKGEGRRERVRGYVEDTGRQTSALLDDTRRTLGRRKRSSLRPAGRSDASGGSGNGCTRRPHRAGCPQGRPGGRCRAGSGPRRAARTPGWPPAACLAARASACLLAPHGHPSRAQASAAQGMAFLPRPGHAARGWPHPEAGPGRGLVCRAG